jgi:hypothetical protein
VACAVGGKSDARVRFEYALNTVGIRPLRDAAACHPDEGSCAQRWSSPRAHRCVVRIQRLGQAQAQTHTCAHERACTCTMKMILASSASVRVFGRPSIPPLYRGRLSIRRLLLYGPYLGSPTQKAAVVYRPRIRPLSLSSGCVRQVPGAHVRLGKSRTRTQAQAQAQRARTGARTGTNSHLRARARVHTHHENANRHNHAHARTRSRTRTRTRTLTLKGSPPPHPSPSSSFSLIPSSSHEGSPKRCM